MTVRVYSCGMMDNLREREMMKSLVKNLQERYRDYDDCIILVEPEFSDDKYGYLHKPDCIVFKDNTIIVLELKTWLGEFEINLENHSWKAKGNPKLQKYIDELREKPDGQCIRHSNAIKELLLKKFANEFLPDKYQRMEPDRSSTDLQWSKVLREYVILQSGSIINVKSSSFDPRPRIVCADKFPNEITQLRKEQKWLPDSVIKELISIFHGRLTDIDHLFSKPNQMKQNDTLGRVEEYVKNLLRSNDSKVVLSGLELSSDMKLISLYKQIREIYLKNKTSKITINALKSIIALDQSDLKYLFTFGLSGNDPELIEFILDLIIKYPYFSDIYDSLEGLLSNNDQNIVKKSIKAMSLNRTNNTCGLFEATLTSIFVSRPYEAVNTLSKLEMDADKIRNADREMLRKQSCRHLEVHVEKKIYVDSCILCKQAKIRRDLLLKHVKAVALIEAMGICNCRRSARLITDTIEYPEKVGMPTLSILFDENIPKPNVNLHDKAAFSTIVNQEHGVHVYYYFDLLKCGLNTMANMAYHESTKTFRKILQLPYEDAKICAIDALGKLGGNRELKLIEPFVQEQGFSHLKYNAILSLTEMGEPSVFNQIVNTYFSSIRGLLEQKINDEGESSLYYTKWVYKASKDYLRKVDPGGFEHILIDAIRKEESYKVKGTLLKDLFDFSTEESANFAFSLIEDSELHDYAESILYRLSDTETVINKGRELLASKDEENRAFAFRLLILYFKGHIDELDCIPIISEKDLESKLDLYSYFGLWPRLLNYLFSPNKDIREYALSRLHYLQSPMKLHEHYQWVTVDNENIGWGEIEIFSLGPKFIIKKASCIDVYDLDSMEMDTLQMETGKLALYLHPAGENLWMYIRLQEKDEYGDSNFSSIAGLLKLINKEINNDLSDNSSKFSRKEINYSGFGFNSLDYVHWINLWEKSVLERLIN